MMRYADIRHKRHSTATLLLRERVDAHPRATPAAPIAT